MFELRLGEDPVVLLQREDSHWEDDIGVVRVGQQLFKLTLGLAVALLGDQRARQV